MRKLGVIIASIFAVSGLGYGIAAAASSRDTGTNVACATATAITPDHTVGVDGTSVDTIPGVTTTAADCETQTYTIPTVSSTETATQTVTQTVTATPTTPTTGSTPTSSSTSSTSSSTSTSTTTTQTTSSGAPQTNCAGATTTSTVDYQAIAACGYPTPATTGVPDGTQLTSVKSINCSNTKIDAVTTTGTVTIGSGCTITNSRLIGQITVQPGPTNVLLSHDEISGAYTGTAANPTCSTHNSSDILWEGAPAGVTLDSDYLHCAAEPFNGNGIVKNSYIISDECWGPCGSSSTTHNEAVYIAGGNSSSQPGSDLEHNTILNPWPQTAGIFGDDHAWGPIHNLTITNNLVADGGDNGAIPTGCKGDGNTNVNITNNRLAYVFDRSMVSGGYGGGSWSGNYRDDTLAAVPAAC